MINNIRHPGEITSSRLSIKIPKSSINHWKGDSYSTTDNPTMIKDANYCIEILLNQKWIKLPDLKLTEVQPHELYTYIPKKYGYSKSGFIGYTTDNKLSEDQWRNYHQIIKEFKDILSNNQDHIEESYPDILLEIKSRILKSYNRYYWISIYNSLKGILIRDLDIY